MIYSKSCTSTDVFLFVLSIRTAITLNNIWSGM